MRARLVALTWLLWAGCGQDGGGAGGAPAPSLVDPTAQERARIVESDGDRVRLAETFADDGKVVRQEAMAADRLILKVRAGADVAKIAARHDGAVRRKLYARDLWLVDVPGGSTRPDALPKARDAYVLEPEVEYAEPDYVLYLQVTPNDPSYGSLWGMTNINAPLAWDAQTGSPGAKVGVIDTGVDYNHPDLAANIWQNPGEIPSNGIDDDENGLVDDVRGWDFGSDDSDPMDSAQHGTHVAGTIGAVGNNSTGVSGVCWAVTIVPIKISTTGTTLYTSAAVDAVTYATAIGCRLTSNSWGGGGYSTSLYNAIQAAGEAGVLFVAAAGNSNSDNDASPMYPASYNLPNIISVLAITQSNGKASFSSYGDATVDVGAPGVSILSTVPGASYASFSGTSMATPHVAGACALVWAEFPTQTAAWVKARILGTATPTAALADLCVSGGRLNLDGAINGLPPTVTIASPPAGSTTATSPATVTGTAADPDGTVVSVTWANAASGGAGSATGTATWSAAVPLVIGANAITVTAADNEGKTATASRTITYDPPPVLSLDATSLVFGAEVGTADPAPQTVKITNGGGQTLAWSAAEGELWLMVAPSGGSLTTGQWSAMTVTASIAGLEVGTYSAQITLDAPGATHSPQTIQVTLNVTAPAPPASGGGRHGRCGSVGLDLMLPLGILWMLRRRRR